MIIILISILKNLVSFLFQTAQHHTGQAFFATHQSQPLQMEFAELSLPTSSAAS